MRLILAPMEGVVDATLRDLLTRDGGFDRCITEFVRITEQKLPSRVFRRICPELDQGGKTPAGTPVYLQLLGGNPEYMALNARTAERLGAPGIDLNFGCPSKTVNKNEGGSILLREPERVYSIVKAVRESVSPHVPVTAKIRLGFCDGSLFEDIALGVEAAGADELCVHARTKQQGYQPPAYWSEIGKIKPKLTIPIIANGEIWSVADARRAQEESACADLMLGRGALSFPALAVAIRTALADEVQSLLPWASVLELLQEYTRRMELRSPKHTAGYVKQWANYLRRQYPEAEAFFQHIKRLKQPAEIYQAIRESA